jgi:hypothetical protein
MGDTTKESISSWDPRTLAIVGIRRDWWRCRERPWALAGVSGRGGLRWLTCRVVRAGAGVGEGM